MTGVLDVNISDNEATPPNLNIDVYNTEFLTATGQREPNISNILLEGESPIATRAQLRNTMNNTTQIY